MYLTYEEFISFGGICEATTYSVVEFKARKIIDKYTQKRVALFETIPDYVKHCMFDIINLELLYNKSVDDLVPKDGSSGGKVVASFSNDGYSETYAVGSGNSGEYLLAMRNSIDANEIDTIKTYFACEYYDDGKRTTPMLYRGVY